MKKAALLLSLSLFAGALSAQSAAGDKFGNPSERGVSVQVLPPIRESHEPLRYVLNVPAYVAAFVVYPGAGVRLLYPTTDTPEKLQSAGYHSENLYAARQDGDFYSAVLGTRLDGAIYLYVIASRSPIDVAQYVHGPMHLASAIGQQNARSFYPDVAFSALVDHAISLGDDTSWGADEYTLWPKGVEQERLANQTIHYRVITCANGTQIRVPDSYPFLGCPSDAKVRPNGASAASRPTQQSASARAAAAVAPTVGSATVNASLQAANLAAESNEKPTVLPTIVGKRRTAVERGAAGGNATQPAPTAVMYTTANGDPEPKPEPAHEGRTVAPGVQFVPMDVPDRRRSNEREAAERAARFRKLHAGEVVGGPPQLAPNPQLSPNPKLAPAPNVAPAEAPAARSRAPEQERREAQQRRVRESLRVPPTAHSAPSRPTPRQTPTPAKP